MADLRDLATPRYCAAKCYSLLIYLLSPNEGERKREGVVRKSIVLTIEFSFLASYGDRIDRYMHEMSMRLPIRKKNRLSSDFCNLCHMSKALSIIIIFTLYDIHYNVHHKIFYAADRNCINLYVDCIDDSFFSQWNTIELG